MAEKKEQDIVKNQTEETGTMVVSLSKFTEGISIVFSGVITMLQAFDSATASRLAEALVEDNTDSNTDSVSDTGNKAKNGADRSADGSNIESNIKQNKEDASDKDEPTDAEISADAEVDTSADVEETKSAKSANTTKKAKQKVSEPREEQPASAASTLTPDDITKVLVQKIKQNRDNSAKIGSILKTYGVAKVSELKPTQYEAFMTDIAAL